jgi:hypothetical protein
MTLTSLPYQHPIMPMRTSLCGGTHKHSVHHGLIKAEIASRSRPFTHS